MNVGIKSIIQRPSSFRINLLFIIAAMTVLIAVLWSACFAFFKYDRESTISMYGGRQHAVLALSGLALRAANSIGGAFGMMIVEESMRNADKNPVIKETVQRHQRKSTNDENMVGYGNMIITMDKSVVLVSGGLSRYFRDKDSHYEPRDKMLRKHINRFTKKLHESKKDEYIRREIVEIGGREYLFTATSFNFMPRKPVIFLYANTNKILAVYGYYKRRMWFARTGALCTLIILLGGGLMIAGLLREQKVHVETQKLAQDLQKEIFERACSEQEKDKLREQLVQSQKMDAIGQLAGGLAHDFNNMLGVIMGNADLMLHTLNRNDPSYKRAYNIMQSALRSRNLTMKLLTFARKEKLNAAPMDMRDIISDLMTLLERSIQKKIEIITDIQNDLIVKVDANQIEQALMNICTNARDAMPSGGVLSIESHIADSNDINLLSHFDGEQAHDEKYCRIIIRDTGIGMSGQTKEKIFDPFFTTKGAGAGTGLGMTITMGIIRSHNGYISIDSEPDQGTTVSLYLPIDENGHADAVVKDAEPDIIKGTGTILLVDDEPDVLASSTELLEEAGYTVLAASSGKEAVEIFRNNASEIVLVILDMVMPHMDGGDVYQALRDIHPDVRVLLASGFSKDGYAGELLEQGVRGFLQKPFRIIEIHKEVSQILDT